MSSRPIIAVDIDDVLSASAPDFVRFSNERWGTTLAVDDYTEHWAEMWQVDIEEVRARREIYLNSGIVGKHRPVVAARDALLELKKQFDIVLVTSRSLELESETRAWLESHYADIADSVYFTGIYSSTMNMNTFAQTKSSIFAELKPAFVIDDLEKHCQAAVDLGIPAILFGTYGWNQADHLAKGITRCNNWREVLDTISAQSV